MPKRCLISWGINFSFGQMKMQNRHMCMCAGESKLQMQQNLDYSRWN